MTGIRAARVAAIAFFALLFVPAAHACLGVSRTITIDHFDGQMGRGDDARIGLRPGEVVLTFDDGPLPAQTERILDTLSAHCTRATFFVVGKMARVFPKTLRRIARSGHTIGHHTYLHKKLTQVSPAVAQQQIADGVTAVLDSLGPYRSRASRLFRYPYLARGKDLDNILIRSNLLPISAEILSNDWRSGSAPVVVQRIMKQLKERGRGIILMHDIQPRTVAALPLLLGRLKAQGYRVVHIRTRGSSRAPIFTADAGGTERSGRSRRVALLARPYDEAIKRRFEPTRSNHDANQPDRRTTGSVRKRTDDEKQAGRKQQADRRLAQRERRRAAQAEARKQSLNRQKTASKVAKRVSKDKTPKRAKKKESRLRAFLKRRRAQRLERRQKRRARRAERKKLHEQQIADLARQKRREKKNALKTNPKSKSRVKSRGKVKGKGKTKAQKQEAKKKGLFARLRARRKARREAAKN